MHHTPPSTGIDFLLRDANLLQHLSQKKVGLLTNQNALTQSYRLSAYALKEKLGESLRCLLTPEHGWSGQVAEGVKIGNGFDSHLNVPILSLYGGAKISGAVDFDVLIIDLQDVGLRCYTYTTTCAKLLENLSDIEVIVCDRPNPLGSQFKGPDLDPAYRSFVGYLDVPFQHGQTIGELLSLHNQTTAQHPFTHLTCPHDHKPYAYPWIPPSPNLPSWESVLLYPALVLLEGTNISEGRGTTLPFTCLGAPELDHYALVNFINTIEGIRARPLLFTPQSGKLTGKECQGAHLLIIDLKKFDAYTFGMHLLHFLRSHYPLFEWNKTAKDGFFIDYLLGTDSLRKSLEKGNLNFLISP
ncbi:MAG: DUF1343 domain-containing protein [Alphaproteobacteria bacterium]|nr:DUF1343 domain-containing protein [Alphaproteobacteria bacterium]MBP7729870.1 DUF1343 domain-containing protein [Alphaproteobacteria bacterium]